MRREFGVCKWMGTVSDGMLDSMVWYGVVMCKVLRYLSGFSVGEEFVQRFL